MKQPVITFFLLIVLSHFSFGQFDLKQEDALKDFQIFKSSIQDIHPGLYWYNDSSVIAKRFDNIEAQIKAVESIELVEFYALVQEFYAGIGCGHSWMSTPYQWSNYLNNGPYRIPINIYFGDNEFKVLHNLSESDEIEEGSSVVSINGKVMQEIYEKLLKFAPSDGYNTTRKRGLIAGNFSKYYQSFIQHDSTFIIQLQNKAGEKVSFTLKGIPNEIGNQRYSERYTSVTKENPLLAFKEIDSNTAYIRIKTFDKGWLKSQKFNYSKFLSESFTSIKEKGCHNLIIDLRGNGGGNDAYSARLLRYLIEEEFMMFNLMETVTKKFEYKAYSSTKHYNLLSTLFIKKNKEKEGFYKITVHPPTKMQKPEKNVYRGDVTVLIDGGSFSAAADAASILHTNGRAKFIGEEIGGGYYGNNSALMYHIKLPNSKINYYLPVVRYYNAVDHLPFWGHGVQPNIKVNTTYEDYIDNRDAALEKALDDIRLHTSNK